MSPFPFMGSKIFNNFSKKKKKDKEQTFLPIPRVEGNLIKF